MIRAFLIIISWLVFMVCNFENPFNLVMGWLAGIPCFILAYAILENKYASFRK